MTLAYLTKSVDENELLGSIQLAKERLDELRRNKEKYVIQISIDTRSTLVPDTDLSSTDSSLAQLKLLCTVVGDQLQSLEDATQATTEKNHSKALKVALVKKFNEDRAKLIHQEDDISLTMVEGHKLLSKICQLDLLCDDAMKKKGQIQLELKHYIENLKVPYDSFIVYGKIV